MIGFGACPSLIGPRALRRRMAKIARELTVVSLSRDNKSAKLVVKPPSYFARACPGSFSPSPLLPVGRACAFQSQISGLIFNHLKQNDFPFLLREPGRSPRLVVFEPHGLDAALEIA
jgi:hypothetical protein